MARNGGSGGPRNHVLDGGPDPPTGSSAYVTCVEGNWGGAT